jgi:hypothetical protein
MVDTQVRRSGSDLGPIPITHLEGVKPGNGKPGSGKPGKKKGK